MAKITVQSVIVTVGGQRIRLQEPLDTLIETMRGAARGTGLIKLTRITDHGAPKMVLIPVSSVDTVEQA